MKTKKAYTNRYRTTKSGSVQARKRGQNHFNAKHPRRKELKKRSWTTVEMTPQQKRRFLPNS